jgi:dolichyl-diphosphooligosaccharide--protein glycosyltransferase
MSQQTERGAVFDPDTALERLREWYHVPVLALVMAFMLWNRVRTWSNFVRDDQVLFAGNDAWYHYRQTIWTVRNWPGTMPFDPWTYFPYGNASGQFGTFFDQIVATAALIVGLGSPSERTIGLVLLFTPAVIGVLTAVPVYYLGKRLGDRPGGLVAVLVLALTPGVFLQRTLVGFADHHAAESLFHALAVFAVAVAVAVAIEEKPVWELVTARDWDALERPLAFGATAGLALALYVWVWPPGVVLFGVLAAYFFLQLSIDFLRGRSPEHVAIGGATAMVIAGFTTMLPMSSLSFSATDFTLLQPLLAFMVAAGLAFMAAFARYVEDFDVSRWAYPAGVLGVGLVFAGVLAVVLPETFGYLVGQIQRIFGLDVAAPARTVGEARPIPLDDAFDAFYEKYGLAYFVAIGAAVLVLYRALTTDRDYSAHLLVVVWAVFMTFATLTQNRFDYYLVLPVAVLTGFFVSAFIQWDALGISSLEGITDVRAYQVIAVVLVILIVTGPFAAFEFSDRSSRNPSPLGPVERAGFNGPDEVVEWSESLEWVQSNTPEEGRYGNPDGQRLDYYGTFARTDDFDYSEHVGGDGAYGVMSWWDYGHFITTIGERIPDANPFQQGAENAASFLLAPNESYAESRLEWGNEETRYVMIDWKLAEPRSRKYSAPTVFDNLGVSGNDVAFVLYNQSARGQLRPLRYVETSRHFRSMRVRLYDHHGSRIESRDRQVIVLDWDVVELRDGQTVRVAPQGSRAIRRFDNRSAAEAFIERDRGTSQIGGIGGIPPEDVPALEHYRLVHATESSVQLRRPQAWVKTFERVPGATVEGQASPNTTVTARVEMQIPTRNETFTYVQQTTAGGDGTFTMTVPYSTTGYANWGPEQGRTNVSVRATGPYEFRTSRQLAQRNGSLMMTFSNGTVDVPEANVIGEAGGPLRVTLTEQSRQVGQVNRSASSSSSSALDGTPLPNGADRSSTEPRDVTDTNTDAVRSAPLARVA